MVMLNGWDINLDSLSGYTEDAQLVEVPHSSLAYIVYSFDEIGVGTMAGQLAVYRDKMNPTLIFHLENWLVVSYVFTVLCNSAETVLLVHVANSRGYMEKHALVDLPRRKFADVFIPNAYRTMFRQIDDGHFLIEPYGIHDSPPYDRSYVIDSSLLTWFDYHRQGEFDNTLVPESQRHLLPRPRDGSWQVLWHKIYKIGLSVTTPMRAKVVTDRVMEQVEHYSTKDPPVDLHALVRSENARLSRNG